MQINSKSVYPDDVTKTIQQFLLQTEPKNRRPSLLVMYAMYVIFMKASKRYSGKSLAPLRFHTSRDSRSRSFGDIDVINPDSTPFESVEIKHNKPITPDMVDIVYRRIKNTQIDRYYILTTSDPNFDNYESVMQEIEKYRKVHPCEIIADGVIPSLKYYLRLISNPQDIIGEYTKWLEFEYRRASGIKREHLQVWQEIRQSL
ncbi:MAG: hypothetical protein AB1607_08900 [Chloroflexota bacterium]